MAELAKVKVEKAELAARQRSSRPRGYLESLLSARAGPAQGARLWCRSQGAPCCVSQTAGSGVH